MHSGFYYLTNDTRIVNVWFKSNRQIKRSPFDIELKWNINPTWPSAERSLPVIIPHPSVLNEVLRSRGFPSVAPARLLRLSQLSRRRSRSGGRATFSEPPVPRPRAKTELIHGTSALSVCMCCTVVLSRASASHLRYNCCTTECGGSHSRPTLLVKFLLPLIYSDGG